MDVTTIEERLILFCWIEDGVVYLLSTSYKHFHNSTNHDDSVTAMYITVYDVHVTRIPYSGYFMTF